MAVYDTRTMENMKMKNASADAFRPAQETQTHQNACSTSNMNDVMMMRVCLTDHPVHHAAEDDARDGAQKQDVRQDLGQEVHRDSVVSTDVLVPEDTPTTASSINQITITMLTAHKPSLR